MVNPPALVHRPQSRSMKDLVHLLLPRVWFTCTTWSWLELSGAAQDMVDVVMVRARWTYSGRGRRGRGRSLAELLGTWSTWSWSKLGGAARDVVDVVMVDVVDEGKNPLLFPNGAPAGGEVTGEPPRQL